jgi:hypothetical protein
VVLDFSAITVLKIYSKEVKSWTNFLTLAGHYGGVSAPPGRQNMGLVHPAGEFLEHILRMCVFSTDFLF